MEFSCSYVILVNHIDKIFILPKEGVNMFGGYQEKYDFHMFSTAHWTAIIVIIIGVILLYLSKNHLRLSSHL